MIPKLLLCSDLKNKTFHIDFLSPSFLYLVTRFHLVHHLCIFFLHLVLQAEIYIRKILVLIEINYILGEKVKYFYAVMYA